MALEPVNLAAATDRVEYTCPMTIIAIGVTSPSAQGQAMIRTATAFTSACAFPECMVRRPTAREKRRVERQVCANVFGLLLEI